MEIDTQEAGFRESIRHDQGRCPITAADVGNPGARLKLVNNAVECGEPLGNKVRLVTWAKETLCSTKQAVAPVAQPMPSPV